MTTTRHSDREQRILDAAAGLIAQYTFDKTTMDDIAREAGVSKGALYLHFKSKDVLVETLILREGERAADQIYARIMNDPEGGSLFKVFTMSLLAVAESPLLRALYTNDRRVLGDVIRRMRESSLFQQGFEFSQVFVEQMQAAGMIRKDLRADVVTYLFALVRFGVLTVEDYLTVKNPPPLEEVAELIADMLERTLAPEGGDNEAGKQAFKQMIQFGRAVIEERRKAMKVGENVTEQRDNPNP
jgi:TetR/AcrR family acrAB operon transcriptional repressor